LSTLTFYFLYPQSRLFHALQEKEQGKEFISQAYLVTTTHIKVLVEILVIADILHGRRTAATVWIGAGRKAAG